MAIGSSNAFAIAGGVVAAGAIGAAAVWFAPPQTQSGAEPQAAAVVTTQAAPEPTVVDAAPTIAAVPTIDTFFRSPDDTTVIAGQAEAGQVVAIVLGGDVIETVTAGADGAFGAVVFIAASDQPRRLRLIADPDGAAIPSSENIIVPPSEIVVAVDTPAPAAPDALDSVTGLTVETTTNAVPDVSTTTPEQIEVASTVTSNEAPQSDATPDISGTADTPRVSASAPPTLIADAQGVRILQPEVTDAPTQPALAPNIALDTITYDPDGEVLLAGRGANSGGFVRVYLDNEPITASRISADGDWRTDLPEVDTGIYTLRVDEVDAEGVVQSRIETPFKKEEPADVAAILAEETSADGFDIAVKTVQPGASLWAIAEEQWGDGVLYVSVFEANRDLIRDPDLIYPGQVFRIPQTAQ